MAAGDVGRAQDTCGVVWREVWKRPRPPGDVRERLDTFGDVSWYLETCRDAWRRLGDVLGDIQWLLETSGEPMRHLESSGDMQTSLEPSQAARERLETSRGDAWGHPWRFLETSGASWRRRESPGDHLESSDLIMSRLVAFLKAVTWLIMLEVLYLVRYCQSLSLYVPC